MAHGLILKKVGRPIPAILLVVPVIFITGYSPLHSQTVRTLPHPKNVILVIGDGMGFNTVKATNFYQGKDKQAYEDFPVRLAVATYPVKAGEYAKSNPASLYLAAGYDPASAWKDTAYVRRNITESAAAATALSTGFKTYNNSIGMSVEFDTLTNLVEVAKSNGKSAGVVTSVLFSHATPAAFVAHNDSRKNYSRIARDMILKSSCDVIMGCGNPTFDDDGKSYGMKWKDSRSVGDSILWIQLREGSGKQIRFLSDGKYITLPDIDGDRVPDPWTIIEDRNDFRQLWDGPTPGRVLGCAKVRTTLQQSRSLLNGETKDSPPYVTPLISTVPTLAEMARGALNVLDNNPSGFFLMVEGGAMDWAAHANQKGRLIEEMTGFNQTIDAIIEWVNLKSSWEETLLIVTGDHETGYLWGGVPFVPIQDNGSGKLPVMQFNSTDHTNSLVPIYAKGCGSEFYPNFADDRDSVRGPYIQNSEIPQLIKILWFK